MNFAFTVFGCRLNQAEAAQWQDALEARGWKATPIEQAEILFVHSCAVTEPAAHEVLRTLHTLRAKRPTAKIILSGCAATLLPENVANLVIPHERKTEWLNEVLAFLQEPATLVPPLTKVRHKTRATLIIQDGCNQFCSYCIVPHLRGMPVSEPLPLLLRQAERFFAEGYREIVLTGCHLALYRDADSGADFVELLRHLLDIPGEGRFRIGSLEPCTLDDKALIHLIKQSHGRICDFLHFPIQSGSNAVLERMGRHYHQADIRRLLDFVGEELPLCGLGADWIVGFPGETDENAVETQSLIQDYPFTGAHLFPYSPRPGTAAASFTDAIPQHRIKARVDALTAIANTRQAQTISRYLDQPLMVIPEIQRHGQWEGWSAQHIRCQFSRATQRGLLVPFTPTRLAGTRLLEN
ncbi:MAG: MiaB/RimO family radical SAM methylthiotransferase [Kiritimatiellia bacterium]